MRICAIQLRIETEQGVFGFEHEFGPNLTIIKGRNSSGKSTLVNCLLYSLGMEELVGGRNELTLPYAVKEWFEFENADIQIDASEVLVVVKSMSEQFFTFRRSIKHSTKSTKLIEIASGNSIFGDKEFQADRATYLFDAGSAQIPEGFHHFLENFLGFDLPQVAATNGGHSKLYLQTIFAALAVEQKRGWTDYIANIPFFGIREARTRVVEYLLGLNVFEAAARRSKLDGDAVAINHEWESLYRRVNQLAASNGLSVRDVHSVPKTGFGAATPVVNKRIERGELDIRTYLETLRAEYQGIEVRTTVVSGPSSGTNQTEFDNLFTELQRLTNLYETATASVALHKGSWADMEEMYTSAREDLSKNRTTAKLRNLGAEHELEIASGRCPTCHQDIADSLIDSEIAGPQMDLATNIAYLEKQCAMFERQIAGLTQAVREGEVVKAELTRRMTNTREQLHAIRRDLTSVDQQSRLSIRRQLQIESEVKQLEEAETSIATFFVELQKLSGRLALNQELRGKLPSAGYSDADELRLGVFEKNFRANASAFEYESADVSDIEINRQALLPVLTRVRSRTDIKADSSASDFVRLIWSYLLALYQTSANPNTHGHHPGFLLFDEPGQHSMAATSQHALMQHLAGESGLQSIVAASFDESEVVFREATAGVEFKLIQLERKAINRLN